MKVREALSSATIFSKEWLKQKVFADQKKPLALYCWFIILLIYLFEQAFF